MSKYLLQGQLQAKPGKGEELAEILCAASQLVSQVEGNQFYIVSTSAEHPDVVFVTEVWNTKEDHANSLQAAGVKELISKAIPLLAGQPSKGQELNIIAGV